MTENFLAKYNLAISAAVRAFDNRIAAFDPKVSPEERRLMAMRAAIDAYQVLMGPITGSQGEHS